MSSIKRSHLPPQQKDQGFPSLAVAVAQQQAQKLRPDSSEATAAKPRSQQQQQEACCSGLRLKPIREHPEMVRSLKMLLLCILSLALVLTISTELTQRMGGVPDILNQTLNFTRQRIHSELVDAINGGSSSSSGHGGELQQRPTPGVFNRTLLHYAAVQLGEEEEKQKIAGLLETAAFGGRNYRRVAEHDSDPISRRHARSVPLQLFHPKFAPFWSEFRRSLRAWVFNKRYNPRVMAELSALVKEPLDRHYNLSGIVKNPTSSGRYGSCAVVGNSGILVAGSHGQLIDSHDIVIRLNNARILGFAASVGSKTSLAFVNSNILHLCSRRARCYCHPYGEQVPILMYICQAVHFMDYAFCNASHKAPLLITDARFDNLCARIVKYYSLKNFVEKTGKGPEEWSSAHEGAMFHYSSGMQAVMLALGICDQVNLFGFGKSPNAKHHYHTNQKAELPLHDYEAEYQLYHDLANRSPNIPFLGDSGIDLPPLKIYL